MEQQDYKSKLDTIYESTKARTLIHLEQLKNAEDGVIIESENIFQYLQQTIDCLQLCIQNLPKEGATRQRYARYKDELGELGDEIVKFTKR